MKTTQRHFQTALVAGLLLVVIVLPSRAADVRGLARLGADFGGDTLVVAQFILAPAQKSKPTKVSTSAAECRYSMTPRNCP